MITHRTVILDDDPTGTQEATGVPVMLWRDRALLIDLLRGEPTVFILTNSRALPEAEAVLLLEDIRSDIKGLFAFVVNRPGDEGVHAAVFVALVSRIRAR